MTSYLCRLGFHKARDSQISTAGWYFSRCTRCDRDMIRRPEGPWHAVPNGHHIVWRAMNERRVAYVVPKGDGRESLPNLLNEMGAKPID